MHTNRPQPPVITGLRLGLLAAAETPVEAALQGRRSADAPGSYLHSRLVFNHLCGSCMAAGGGEYGDHLFLGHFSVAHEGPPSACMPHHHLIRFPFQRLKHSMVSLESTRA